MVSKELLKRIDERDYLTEREHREFLDKLNKDLEEYEEIKKLMGTPIQDIMKKLKVLEIIKKWFMEYTIDYSKIDNTFFVDTFIRDDEPIFKILEEWLNGKC